jgi:hypothetical protein
MYSCDAQGLRSHGDEDAVQLLLKYVTDYYSSGCTDPRSKVYSTALGPLYFQHPGLWIAYMGRARLTSIEGHSMTIIGVEKRTDGSTNLLVFDPMFRDSTRVTRLIGRRSISGHAADLLKAYRRPTRYLRRYREFEVLR